MTAHSLRLDRSNPRAVRELLSRYRAMYLSTGNKGAHTRVPHPGDILYWVGCVGAISAILFAATR